MEVRETTTATTTTTTTTTFVRFERGMEKGCIYPGTVYTGATEDGPRWKSAAFRGTGQENWLTTFRTGVELLDPLPCWTGNNRVHRYLRRTSCGRTRSKSHLYFHPLSPVVGESASHGATILQFPPWREEIRMRSVDEEGGRTGVSNKRERLSRAEGLERRFRLGALIMIASWPANPRPNKSGLIESLSSETALNTREINRGDPPCAARDR